MTHDVRHDEVLAQLLAGDVGEEAPAVRAQLDGCEGCRERWSGVTRLATRIDEVEAERRTVLAAVSRRARTPDSPRFAAQLAELRESARIAAPPHVAAPAPPADRTPHRRAVGRWVAALAACAAIVLVYLQFAGRRAPGHEQRLGAPSIDAIAPLGIVSVFDRFEWSYRPADGDRCELVIVGADDGELVRRTVDASSAEFSTDATKDWPDEIRWRVIVHPAGGGDGVSSSFFAARRSR